MLLFDRTNFEPGELLDLIPGNVSMLNEEGEIIYVNSSWLNYFKSEKDSNYPIMDVGSNYLAECQKWEIISKEQISGIRSVLNGKSHIYETVYLCPYHNQERWFLLKAVAATDKKGCMVLKFDVTEKKSAEEKNIINEAILKSLIDNSPALIYIKDMSGKYTHVNKMFEQIIGIKKEDIIGKKPYEVFPWDVADQFVKNDRKVIGTRKPLVLEEQFTVKKEVKTFHTILFPLHWGRDNLIGIAGIASDITDRKIAEDRLQKYKDELEDSLSINEERLQLFFDATTDGVWDWNLQADEMFFSPRWLESLGYHPGELVANSDSWKRLIHPDDLQDVMKSLSEHLEGKSEGYQCENRILKKDGSWRWNLDRGRVVKRDESGKPLRIVGSDTDITRLKEAEFALRASEQNLAQAQEMACIGSWEMNVKENSFLWSDEVYQIFGVEKDIFKPNYESFLAMVHPEDRSWVHEEYMRCVQDKKEYDLKHRIILPDGSQRIVHEKSKTFYDSNGEPERAIGTVCDITEKKRAEESLKKSRQQLRDLSNKLQTIREEDKKRISREIHDELGQILTAIKLDLTWLEKRIDISDHSVQEKIESIYSHLATSLETVRRVSTELRPQVLDVMGFCEALQWQAEKFIENTNINCKLNIVPEGIRLESELSTDLFRIFQEALTNISRHSMAKNVIVDFVENKNGYELSVKDDGVGIDSTRIDHSNSLGLLGIRERVLIWKGHVDINGVVGEGTQLTVSIPKADK